MSNDRGELVIYWWYSAIILALTLFGIVAIFDMVRERVAGISISHVLLSRYLILTVA